MKQINAEFEAARVCYFYRNVRYEKAFKSMSCLENFRSDLNGNNWDDKYRTTRRLETLKTHIEPFFLFLRFEKCMTNERENAILNFLNNEFLVRMDQNMKKIT